MNSKAASSSLARNGDAQPNGAEQINGSVAFGSEPARRPAIKLSEPEIAVVIPVYKQPQYLKDAVTSVLKQSIIDKVRIVIVNDGCPYAATDAIARTFFAAYPGLIYYLRKSNGGLSSARNFGIRFALASWPSVKAIFPLDADNKFSARTLETLLSHLTAAPNGTGWIYQDLVSFGIQERTWHTGVPFSVYRLVHENCCDAGSLVDRSVFDAGIWYDEQMRNGYEDWEFFVNAALHGFRGVHSRDTNFLYRRHGHSMLSDSKADHASVMGYIWRKHADALAQSKLTRLEHREMPRFALVDASSASSTCVTNALDASAPSESVDAFFERLAAWAAARPPKKSYVPPVTLIVDGRFLQLLRRLRLLPGILLSIQKALSRLDVYELCCAPDVLAHRIELVAGSGGAVPMIYALKTKTLLYWAQHDRGRFLKIVSPRSRAGIERATIRMGRKWFVGQKTFFQELCRTSVARPVRKRARKSAKPSALARQSVALMKRLSRTLGDIVPVEDRVEDGELLSSHANFAEAKHLYSEGTTFPFFSGRDSAERHLLFVLPWMQLGGVELCMLHWAKELAALAPNLRMHLLLTTKNLWEASPKWLDVFTTVSFAPVAETDRDKVLLDWLRYANVVINAHSMPTYRLWPTMRRKTRALYLTSLHVMELGKEGLPWGYPMIAAREQDNLIDYFVVPSDNLRRSCETFGAPSEKIIVARNAAAVAPASREEAIALAQAKSARRYSRKRPLRVLFSGRFDVQKGIDRLEETARNLTATGLPCAFEVRGKAVISVGQRPPRIAGGRILEPSVDRRVLTRMYEQADVFFLPSRWEGAPLTILEAMSFGCIVISTNVGGISEIVEDRVSGFLLSNGQPDSAIAATACQLISQIIANPEEYTAMRIRAVERAMCYTWRLAAEAILTRIKTRLDLS
jgi:glycosyltransferase involved in cell wall biosynthesis/GT2 family glycosyltransferase